MRTGEIFPFTAAIPAFARFAIARREAGSITNNRPFALATPRSLRCECRQATELELTILAAKR